MKGPWLFRIAVGLSLAVHIVLLAHQLGNGDDAVSRLVKIPVILEAPHEPLPPEPPPPEPPPPEPKAERKPRPAKLPQHIDNVVEGDGLRTGELVEAEAGDYDQQLAPPPPKPLPEPPRPVKTATAPAVDKAKLARSYLDDLREELLRRQRYPVVAQRMGVKGNVTVSFIVQPDGTFADLRLRRSSGHDILDNAALDTVRGLSGIRPCPKELETTPLRTSVILRYEMKT